MSNPPKENNIEKSLIHEINNTLDYDTNLQNITEIITNYFLVDFCLIISDFNNLRYFYKVRNSSKDQSIFSQIILSDLMQIGWLQDLKNEKKLKSISDLTHKKYEKLSYFFEKIGIKSLLGIGTNLKGETNGIIILGRLKPDQWSQKDKKKLKEIANIVGIACHLSQINTIIDEKNISKDSSFSLSNIPKLLEENPILRLWWESTRKQLEKQLEWNRKVIYNMITIMSDQTRNPLAIIKMVITVLRTKKLSSEDFNRRLIMLEEACSKLHDINDKILQLKHLKSQNLTCNLVEVNCKQFISNITTSYQNKWKEDSRKSLNLSIKFDFDSEKIIETDSQHLTNILEELLTNAGKFSVYNSTINIKVTEDNDPNNASIVILLSNISEYGSQDSINDFFEPFYREQIVIDSGIPGIGVGLYIIQDLVARLRGKISVEYIPTDNPKHCKIVFRLVLPQSLSSL